MKILITAMVLLNLSSYAQQSKQSMMTETEKEKAVQILTNTRSHLETAVNGLDNEQLHYRATLGKWNIEECVKHISAAETTLWGMVETSLGKKINPEDRAGVKMNDEELIKAVEDRSHRSVTFAALEPANSPYKTGNEALAAFQGNRNNLITFVKTTKADLRNHVLVLPLGTYDAYQFILLIAAHTDRHIQQIEEVKADPAFPK